MPFEANEYVRTRLWSLDYSPLDHDSRSSVNLILGSSDKDLKKWPCRYDEYDDHQRLNLLSRTSVSHKCTCYNADLSCELRYRSAQESSP